MGTSHCTLYVYETVNKGYSDSSFKFGSFQLVLLYSQFSDRLLNRLQFIYTFS
jgi:hypothetical protein